MKTYFPVKSDDVIHKYYIITNSGKKVYFGASGYSDYTMHKDPERKASYIARHKPRENWGKSGIDTPGFWSLKFLWSYPTKTEAYEYIKKDLKKWGYI